MGSSQIKLGLGGKQRSGAGSSPESPPANCPPISIKTVLQVHVLLNPLLRGHARCWRPAASISHAWQRKTKKKTGCSNNQEAIAFLACYHKIWAVRARYWHKFQPAKMASYFEILGANPGSCSNWQDAKNAPSCHRGFVLWALAPWKF